MAKPKKTTLEKIFDHPPNKNLKWREIVTLIEQFNGSVTSRGGSKKVLRLPDSGPYFTDAPHGSNPVDAGAIVGIKKWLKANGITPEGDN